MFEEIKNDPYIKKCYKLADDPNSEDGFWVYHGFNHIDNVVESIQNILKTPKLQLSCMISDMLE